VRLGDSIDRRRLDRDASLGASFGAAGLLV